MGIFDLLLGIWCLIGCGLLLGVVSLIMIGDEFEVLGFFECEVGWFEDCVEDWVVGLDWLDMVFIGLFVEVFSVFFIWVSR